MSRLGVCVLVMLIISVASVFSLYALDSSAEKLADLTDDVIYAAENGTREDVLRSVDSLEKSWEKYHLGLSFIVQSNRLYDISCSISRLRPLYEYGADDFIAECRVIRSYISLMADSQQPELHSVL